MKIKKTSLRHIIKEELRGVSDLLSSARNIRNHLDMIASDVENLNKVMGKANAIHKAIEHQNLEEVGAAASEYISDVKGLSQSLQQSVSEIENMVLSLSEEEKQRSDVARISKKMSQASGLEGMMQKINNRYELLDFLENIIKSVGENIKPNDVALTLATLAKQVRKGN